MKYQKKRLALISKKVLGKKALTPQELKYLKTFEKVDKEPDFARTGKFLAVPLSLLIGFLFATFPGYFENITSHLPGWTNLNPAMLQGLNYWWDFLGEPIDRANILYHLPNAVLYVFGFFGLKKLIEALDRKTWLDMVYKAQSVLLDNLKSGNLNLLMRNNHSILFVGAGDFIGMQFALNKDSNETVTIARKKPLYTDIWNSYDVETLYEDLKNTLIRASGENAGEYIFFPVKDDQIFLPGEHAYDLSPHKLDILCQNIRTIEKELKWKNKRILIIGDKFHKSHVQSEDRTRLIPKSEDEITLYSISKKYKNVSLLDPSDIVIKKIIEIAGGRRIIFRATKEGIKEYKARFYERLKQLGYRISKTKKGILTIGYDIFEDQTEQQTLSRKIDDYFPVVLSKSVSDALIRNGYKEEEFLYVPSLVIEELTKEADSQ
jgi:hypothetical protein